MEIEIDDKAQIMNNKKVSKFFRKDERTMPLDSRAYPTLSVRSDSTLGAPNKISLPAHLELHGTGVRAPGRPCKREPRLDGRRARTTSEVDASASEGEPFTGCEQ